MRRAEPLYMLDANIVSALIDRPGTARRDLCEQRLRLLDGDLAISVVVDAETRAGFAKARSLQKEARYLELKRRLRIEYIDRDLGFAEVYAIERAALLRSGAPLSRLDTFIVAHAIALGATLVSNDRALARVERLKLENWLWSEPATVRGLPGVAEPAAIYATRGAARPVPEQAGVGVWLQARGAARYVGAHAH